MTYEHFPVKKPEAIEYKEVKAGDLAWGDEILLDKELEKITRKSTEGSNQVLIQTDKGTTLRLDKDDGPIKKKVN